MPVSRAILHDQSVHCRQFNRLGSTLLWVPDIWWGSRRRARNYKMEVAYRLRPCIMGMGGGKMRAHSFEELHSKLQFIGP
jgi:hypothetical protein